MCEFNGINCFSLYVYGLETCVGGSVTVSDVLPKTEFGDRYVYTEGDMVVLELLGFLLVVSKYFMLVILLYCSMLGVVNNLLYVVILGRVLIVVFVISVLMGSLNNVVLPFVMILINYVGGPLFFVIMVVLLVM